MKWLRKRAVPVSVQMRDLLFCDQPLAECASRRTGEDAEPWYVFAAAQQSRAAGDTERARGCLRSILDTEGVESRQCLQAWSALHELGETPPDDVAGLVLGVVVEVAEPKGLDVLAAYADHSARYYGRSNAGLVWERPDDRLDSAIDALLACGQLLSEVVGLWGAPRLTELPPGCARISMLTPAGLHFGRGPFMAMSKDNMGGPLLALAAALLQQLTSLPGATQSDA